MTLQTIKTPGGETLVVLIRSRKIVIIVHANKMQVSPRERAPKILEGHHLEEQLLR
jgi:hypothetical protein